MTVRDINPRTVAIGEMPEIKDTTSEWDVCEAAT